MVHTYTITGMTCNGCRAHVEKALNEVDEVRKAEVDLEKAEAKIEMEKHIGIEKFQKALQEAGGNYQITSPKTPHEEEDKDIMHTYKVAGMTCKGCKAHVAKALNDVDGVRNAEVDLEKAEA